MPKMQTTARRAARKTATARRSWLLFCALLLVVLVCGLMFYLWAGRSLTFSASPVEFHIERGASLRGAVQIVRDSGVELSENAFVLLARITRSETAIKAGSYEIHAGVTPLALLTQLTRGDVSQAELVIPEGWTFRQIRARMDAHPDLVHQTTGLEDREILRRLALTVESPEGWFFPDKYLFDRRTNDLDLLARSHRMMARRLEALWAERRADSPLRTPQELLILASIIEKETGRNSDRPWVAAVFANRLRIGMPLQSDPTVIYGLGDAFDGNLRKRDLQMDTPYNTYTRPGLPPTPIAVPGEASIHAALNPAPTKALYFVARGDGSSEFSETLESHNRAVNRYQRGGGS